MVPYKKDPLYSPIDYERLINTQSLGNQSTRVYNDNKKDSVKVKSKLNHSKRIHRGGRK